MKTYSELIRLKTFTERFNYLQTHSNIGDPTFGSYRYINQKFYNSNVWKAFRQKIIVRDLGCDLSLLGYEILYEEPIIHHIIPITDQDFLRPYELILNAENVVLTSKSTHRQIHFGVEDQYDPNNVDERFKNDTCPWKGV